MYIHVAWNCTGSIANTVIPKPGDLCFEFLISMDGEKANPHLQFNDRGSFQSAMREWDAWEIRVELTRFQMAGSVQLSMQAFGGRLSATQPFVYGWGLACVARTSGQKWTIVLGRPYHGIGAKKSNRPQPSERCTYPKPSLDGRLCWFHGTTQG